MRARILSKVALAGAIAANQAYHFALPDFEVGIAQRPDIIRRGLSGKAERRANRPRQKIAQRQITLAFADAVPFTDSLRFDDRLIRSAHRIRLHHIGDRCFHLLEIHQTAYQDR